MRALTNHVSEKKHIIDKLCFIHLGHRKMDTYKKNVAKADDRQGVVLPIIGAPFLAATLPLAAAGAIGVYGAYGDVITSYLNSLIGIFFMHNITIVATKQYITSYQRIL